MKNLLSVNYLVKYESGDLALFTDTFERKIRMRQYSSDPTNDVWESEVSLTYMVDVIRYARNYGHSVYVFEEWGE